MPASGMAEQHVEYDDAGVVVEFEPDESGTETRGCSRPAGEDYSDGYPYLA